MDSTENPNTANGSESSQHSIQTLLPGTQLEIASPGTRVKSEAVEAPANGKNRTNGKSRVRSGSSSGKKRARQTSMKHADHPVKKMKEDDNTCAHLHPLQDHLLHGLDVVFCGINPGRMSAETGHHYANPTNHFWRCLHRSGMTSTLVSPFEDFSLPERFNIGLTNLVDQSSTQARELSRADMIGSVPTLLNKLERHRPRFVCFVGVIIWDMVRNSLMKLLPSGTGKGKGQRKGKNQMGLQSYKLVWEDVKCSPQETLIFVVPSTSGRVVQYQLTDKIALFTELYRLMTMSDTGIDNSGIESIVWDSKES